MLNGFNHNNEEHVWGCAQCVPICGWDWLEQWC